MRSRNVGARADPVTVTKIVFAQIYPSEWKKSDVSWRTVGDAITEPWAEARTQIVL